MVDPDGEWAWAAVGGIIGGVFAYRAAKRKRGWKLVGATVGGAAFGAIGGLGFRSGKIWYNTTRHWYKGTFKSSRKSLQYHYKKHVVKKGKSYSKRQYTKMAKNFYKKNKHLRKK
ncbi:hypothetical protein [Virgibacillus pantothenticus]|uniref:hypothetical protein n=1 Tax=Virgibacillus pantothenticus TaxID=1473 RepID=UPI001BAFBDAA|nr:hypothetical protein [Virgibacillus pantothenticus]